MTCKGLKVIIYIIFVLTEKSHWGRPKIIHIIKQWSVLNIQKDTIESIKTEARKFDMPIGEYLDSVFNKTTISNKKESASWTIYGIPADVRDEIKQKARSQNLHIGAYLEQLMNSNIELEVQNKVLNKVYKNLEDSIEEYHKNRVKKD